MADTLGRPVRLIVTAGQVGDCTQAEALLEGQSTSAVLADKAYDSNASREKIAAMKAEAVIPSNRSRKIIIPHDTLRHHRDRQYVIPLRSEQKPQRKIIASQAKPPDGLAI